jgi:two-component system chemotaxis response regulator CheB
VVAAALNRDADLQVVATAANGRIALSRLDECRPDVVLLDLEMPELDGLETLTAIRQQHPRLPVIMFSRHTQRGVEATVHALTLGANDYVPKPGDGLEVDACVQTLLIPKIKLHGRRAAHEMPTPLARATSAIRPSRSAGAANPVELIVLAASTGGPNALVELLPHIPPDWTIPILIVQHMPPGFTTRLAERLAEKSRLRVREACSGAALVDAQAWVAPGDQHLVLAREPIGLRLVLHQGPPVNSCRPSADVLFESAAEVFGAGVLGVVLTGMGQDGMRGCEAIRRHGGHVLAQDEATSVVWGMPGAVAQAGLADLVLPLAQLGPEIVHRAGRPRPGRSG